MNGIPRLPDLLGVPDIGSHDVPEGTWRGFSIKTPPFSSIRQMSSLPTQTCTWGGSKLFSLVLTTKRNWPSTATVGMRNPRANWCLSCSLMREVYHITIHLMKSCNRVVYRSNAAMWKVSWPAGMLRVALKRIWTCIH